MHVLTCMAAPNCRNLVLGMRQFLSKANYSQSPCLECEERWADEPFVLK